MFSHLQQAWYRDVRWPLLLLPLSTLYGVATGLRRLAYRRRWLRQQRVEVPVIVVGNLTVGGSGKTPLVAWLVEHLGNAGWRPGVVSRGYGGRARQWPLRVTAQSNPLEAGDEPVMLALTTGCPVAVAPDRVAAARLLIADGVDIIVADDGLQHYALARDLEIAVRDGERGYGNGHLLPAGPLREPLARLQTVDLEWINAADGDFALQVAGVRRLDERGPEQSLADFAGATVHAVAGIGYPQRFFDALRARGLQVIAHAYPDHHVYRAPDIVFNDDYAVFMTAKDAVKCRPFALDRHWVVPVRARVTAKAEQRLDQLIANIGPKMSQTIGAARP